MSWEEEEKLLLQPETPLTQESRGRFSPHIPSPFAFTAQSQPFPPCLLSGQGRGNPHTNSPCILQLDFEHLHGSGDNHLAGTCATARQHLPQQCQLFPARRKERKSQSEEVAWSNTRAAGCRELRAHL